MRQQRSYPIEAIVLKRTDIGEADRILTLFTPNRGKMRAVAKGIRRPISKKAGHLELLNRSQLQVALGRARTLNSSKRFEDAKGVAEEALYDPTLTDVHLRASLSSSLAIALSSLNRFEDAKRVLEEALRNPALTDPDLRMFLSNTLAPASSILERAKSMGFSHAEREKIYALNALTGRLLLGPTQALCEKVVESFKEQKIDLKELSFAFEYLLTNHRDVDASFLIQHNPSDRWKVCHLKEHDRGSYIEFFKIACFSKNLITANSLLTKSRRWSDGTKIACSYGLYQFINKEECQKIFNAELGRQASHRTLLLETCIANPDEDETERCSLVKLLVDKGYSILGTTGKMKDISPVHAACFFGHKAILEYFSSVLNSSGDPYFWEKQSQHQKISIFQCFAAGKVALVNDFEWCKKNGFLCSNTQPEPDYDLAIFSKMRDKAAQLHYKTQWKLIQDTSGKKVCHCHRSICAYYC